MIRNLTLVLLAPFLWIGTVPQLAAQEVLHETPGYVWPPAQLDQVAWLSGTWRGVNEEGDEVLETWIGPKGQLMAGAFLELTSEEPEVGVVNWAEHMVIVSNGYSLAFHNNTFDPEYSGDKYLERRLLRIEDDGCRLYFHGMTIACERAEDTGDIIGMSIYWREAPGDRNFEAELFTYRYTRVEAD